MLTLPERVTSIAPMEAPPPVAGTPMLNVAVPPVVSVADVIVSPSVSVTSSTALAAVSFAFKFAARMLSRAADDAVASRVWPAVSRAV